MLEISYLIYTYVSSSILLIYVLYEMSHFFQRKSYANFFNYYILSAVLFAIVYHLPSYFYNLSELPYYYYFICVIIFNLLWTTVFLEGNWLHKLPYLFYYFAFYKCIKFFLGAFYNYKGIISTSTYEILDMLSFILEFFLVYVYFKLCRKFPIFIHSNFTHKQILLMLFCPTSFFILLQLADPSINVPYQTFITIASILLMINIPIIYYLYYILENNFHSVVDLGKALAESRIQLTRYRYTILNEEQAKKERHEIKNRYFYIQTLLKENKIDQLNAYLEDVIGDLTECEHGINTGNVMIDHILNTKTELAHKYGIKTYNEIIIPNNIKINENHFCTILLNLLDNAIEASRKEENPDIQVQMNIRNRYLVCVVKNKSKHNILEENPEFETTKADKKQHGLGMKIIKDCVKKSDAIFDTAMESNYFVASVMMPIEDDPN